MPIFETQAVIFTIIKVFFIKTKKNIWKNSSMLKKFVRAECMLTNVVRTLADVVATKLGIILFSFLPLTFLPEGVCLRF